jgi:hypothetical protein
MPIRSLPFESFGGLDLASAPDESGCIDLLNVDFDQRGRLRSRDGFAKLTTAAALGAYHSLAPFYKTDGTKQLIGAFGGASGAINALNTSGGIVAAQASASSTYASIARFAAPGSEHAYVAVSGSGAATVYRWDGSAWSTPTWTGTTPTGRHLAVTGEGRLANARYNGSAAGNSPSTVRFCDISGTPPAVVPTTWPANNYVEVSPGDGEEIMALVTWRELTFAFKQTKFAVFSGTSQDGSGNPIFNDRLVTSQGLAGGAGSSAYRAIAVAPRGIFFANRRGIWLTTGGPAELVSGLVDPIFRGNVSGFFGSSPLNQNAIDKCAMVWHDEKLWFAYPSGASTTNDRVLRFDPATETWTLYDFPAASLASFRVADAEDLVFCFSGTVITLGAPSSPSATPSQTAGTLVAGTTYYYKVTTLSINGETTPSAEVSAGAYAQIAAPTYWEVDAALLRPNGGRVSIVFNSKVTLVNGTPPGSNTTASSSIAIGWSAVPGATGYRVYRGTASNGENVFFAPGNVTTFTDTGEAGTAGSPPVSNTATTAGFDVARHSSAYTSDGGDGVTTGAGINSRYRQGFWAPDAQQAQATVRELILEGTGTVTVKGSHDWGTLGGSQAVALGTAPTPAENRYRTAQHGRHHSYEFSGSGTRWTLERVQALVRDRRPVTSR